MFFSLILNFYFSIVVTTTIIISAIDLSYSSNICIKDASGTCASDVVEESSIPESLIPEKVIYDIDYDANEEIFDVHYDDDDDYYYDSDDYDEDYNEEEEIYEEVKENKSENCIDKHPECGFWASQGECNENPDYMLTACRKSCDSCTLDQKYGAEQNENDEKTQEIVRKAKLYYDNEVNVKAEFSSVRKNCKNRHEDCSFWASIGECEENPNYMQMECALACRTCEKLDINKRCPLDPNAVDALEAGDLNTMFEEIVKSYKTTVQLHSRPYILVDGIVTEDPWVISLDDFISHKECDKLIELGHVFGYERSKDVGKRKYDGSYEAVESTGRTSSNAWCNETCMEDPDVHNVLDRINNLTGIPIVNSEQLQLLKYDVGQFYNPHHDFIEHHIKRQPGPRILTLFLYLNDVEKGGGTRFVDLDITVMPKKGRVLIWPSVLDSNLNEMEPYTHHEALPVEEGVKYGANAWIHLRDFKTPLYNDCV